MNSPWPKVPLGEITTAQYGLSVAATDDGTVPILGMKNLQGGRIVFGDLVRVSLTKEETAIYRLHAGDILFNRTNSFDLVGKTALVEAATLEPIVFASYLVRLKVDATRAVPQFVNYFLTSPRSEKKLKDMATPGVSQFNINPTQLRKHFQIPLPPLTEQNAIIGVLSVWDRGIWQLSDLITAKLRFKQGLMQQLLTGKRRFPEFENEWEAVRVGDIAAERSERNDGEHSIPVLSCTKYDGLVDSLAYFGKRVFSENTANYKVVRRGDFAYATNHIEEGSIGLLSHADAGLVSPMYTVFRTDGQIAPDFLFRLLKTETYRQIFASFTSASVNRRGSLRWKQFATIPLKLPRLAEQQRIDEALAVFDREIDFLRRELDALKTQKKGLMQKLLTGQVRVKT